MAEIILNRVQCKKCQDVIISHCRHDFNSCRCGNVSVDGGRTYLRRLGADYTELSITAGCEFELIRESLYRGSRGKSGDKPLTWISLANMSNAYLHNLLAYQESNGYTDSVDYSFQLKESSYRFINNIVIKETEDE